MEKEKEENIIQRVKMDKCRQSHFYVLLSSNLQWCQDWGVEGLS